MIEETEELCEKPALDWKDRKKWCHPEIKSDNFGCNFGPIQMSGEICIGCS